MNAEDRLYRKLFEEAPHAVLIERPDGSIVEANRAACELFGYGPEDWTSLTARDLAGEESRASVERVLAESPNVHEVEMILERRDGTGFPAEVRSIRTRIDGQAVIFVHIEDLTRRDEMEAEILKERERYRATLDSVTDAFFSLDESMRVTYFNPAAERVLGRPAGEVVGQNLFDAFPEARGSVFEEVYTQVLRDKQPKDFEVYFDVDRYRNWYDVRVFPQEKGISVYFRVTTREREADRAREESERRYRSIARHFPNGAIFVFDPDLRYLFVDGQEVRRQKLDPEQMIGRRADEIFPPEVANVAIDRCRHIFEGQSVEYEVFYRGHTYLNRGVPIHDEKGEISEGLVITVDITDRKRAEEHRRSLEAQVQHAQKLESLGVLAGGIAHDFNNILMSILGNADLALQDISPVSPARASLQEIDHAARRAADLCRQMLAYSGKGKFEIRRIDLSELVTEMSHMLEVTITKKAVLRYEFADILPAVEGDPTQLRQVIMNLITNASEAIGSKSGIIVLSTGVMECDGDYLAETYLDDDLPGGVYVYLEVSDTGCGMDAETRSRIFDPFFTTKFTGRGLGLAAVLGIVRGHKGAIKVYSEPGRGTSVKVLLPVVEDAADRLEDAHDATGPARLNGCVLVVEDEESVRVLARRMLERLGLQVLTAEDGREGLKIFRAREREINLVLLDLTMPRMDGEECFRELRRLNRDVRVVVSSGYNEQEINQRFAGRSLAGFIQKPYRLTELARILQPLLGAGPSDA